MPTKIEWTNETWNPLVGCSIVSPGCTNCYAMKQAGRLEAMGSPIYRGLTEKTKAGYVWNGKVELSNHGQVIKPLSWRQPKRIFVNSMSDLFHESAPDERIDWIFAVMALCPHHVFQVLTKRAERMRDYLNGDAMNRVISILMREHGKARFTWPLPNVWAGVSCEDQPRADERIPLLLDTLAAVRWISAEPLLGPVDLPLWERPPEKAINWIVIGGESGPGARPFRIEWARSIIRQCKAADVPVFYKQGGRSNRCPHDSKGGHFECFPTDLRVREYPARGVTR